MFMSRDDNSRQKINFGNDLTKISKDKSQKIKTFPYKK